MGTSVKVIVSNESVLVMPDVSSPAVPGAFLALTFTLGLCLNALLVFTIASSSTLRSVAFNCLLLHLGLACGLDCILNVTASVAFVTALERVARSHTSETQSVCRVNAALGLFTVILQTVMLAALAVDRALALHRATAVREERPLAPAPAPAPGPGPASASARLTALLAKAFPILSWLYTIALVVPIVASSHTVAIRPYSSRYSCGVVRSEGAAGPLGAAAYPGALLALAALLPWLATAAAVGAGLLRLGAACRRRRRLEEAALQRSQGAAAGALLWAGRTARDPPACAALALALDDAAFYVMVAALLALYLFLIVPQMLSVHIAPLKTTAPPARLRWMGNASDPNNSPIPPQLTPVATGVFDEIFIWCRYEFTVLAPTVVFLMHRELRKKCQYLFCCCCCCRSNSVTNLEETRSISSMLQKKSQQLKEASNRVQANKSKKHQNKYVRIANYRTPVLFATAEGLHLRLVVDGNHLTKIGASKDWSSQPNFVCEFCDVAIITATSVDTVTATKQSKFGTKAVPKQPLRFGHENIAEHDMHLSDHCNDSGEKLFNMQVKEDTSFARDMQGKNNRKVVRFAQSVDKIPLTESGVWSASDDISLEPMWPSFNSNKSVKVNKSFGPPSYVDPTYTSYFH